MLTGALLTAACFIAFGFCRTLWQAVPVQVLMGLLNGNQGVVSTCLGEITDRSNQSRAFVYLPVIYALGGITGPLLGGTLASSQVQPSKDEPFPYIRPNVVSAAILTLDLILTMIFLEESLEEAKNLPPLGKRLVSLFSWVWQFASSSRPSYLKNGASRRRRSPRLNGDGAVDGDDENESDTDASQESMPTLLPHHNADLSRKQIFNKDTILLLSTFLIFQLCNISYNSLYPLFGQAAPPTGRSLSPREIGISLAFAGAMTIVFQLGFFVKLWEKMGNTRTYKVGLVGMVLAFLLMPWVGHKDAQNGDAGISSGKGWLYAELGFILLIRSLGAVALLLVSIAIRPLVHSQNTLIYTLERLDHQFCP